MKPFEKNVSEKQMTLVAGIRNFLFLWLCVLCIVASAEAVGSAQQDKRLTPAQFPIFPWDELTGLAALKEARDCGFNVAGFTSPENLDQVQAADLKCFVRDARITIRNHLNYSDAQIKSNVSAVVRSTARHPAVFGYHLLDEPPEKELPTVAKWVRAVNDEVASSAGGYVNLLPFPYEQSGESPADVAKYQNYLESFIKEARPRVFSYDNYAVFEDGGIRSTYYLNFEMARDASLKTGVPFWFVGLANAHFRYAEPSYATFRFQVYNALAYGARGMGWFTYLARDRGNYRLSAIDFDGRRTPTWEMLRAANMQIHHLGPVYLQLRSVNVFHHPEIPRGCRDLSSSRHLDGIGGGGSYLVGEYEHPSGKPYFLIVNKSLTKSAMFNPKPKQKGSLMKVSSFTGRVGGWSAENNWLAPGQGMLLFVDKAPEH